MKLPPLPEAVFDGDKQKITIATERCSHIKLTFNPNTRELRCECGAAWNGFGVDKLYEALKKQTT